ncbi:TPA: molecular chaperone [Escherichia coli]
MKANLLLLSFFFPTIVLSASNNTNVSSITFSQSRVIYHESNKHGVQFSISNKNESPYLVQATIKTLDGKKNENFITSPPLFRLDGQEETSIKVIKIGAEPNNIESLGYICVKPIPPKDEKNKDTVVSIVIDSCIKLIYRPSGLEQPSFNDFKKNVKWKIVNDEVYITNNTPYYLNLNAVIYSMHNIPVTYIPPKSTKNLGRVSAIDSNIIKWNYINDLGEIGPMVESKLDSNE